VRVVNAKPRPLYYWEETRNPLYMRLGEPQGRYGRVAENLVPTGIRSRDRPVRSESPYRLRYSGPGKLDIFSDTGFTDSWFFLNSFNPSSAMSGSFFFTFDHSALTTSKRHSLGCRQHHQIKDKVPPSHYLLPLSILTS